jgi:hypothetical protein
VTLRRAVLGSLTILAVAYAGSPWLAAQLLPPLLARWGIESSQFTFGYPRWNGIEVPELALAAADTTVTGANVRVSYRIPRLFAGAVDSVDVEELTVHLGRTAPATDTSGSFDLAGFWNLIPARQVTIRQLYVTNAEPAVSAHGSVSFDPEVLRVRMGVESPLLAVPLDVNGAVNPDGRVAVTLMERGSTAPLGSLTGVPDDDRRAMTFDGRIVLTGRPLVLAGAYAGLVLSSGSAEVNVHGRTSWPLPSQDAWQGFDGDGTFRIELTGSGRRVSNLAARVDGDLSIADGEMKARIESGGFVRAEVPELRRIAGNADLDPHVLLSSDQAVAIDYAQQNVRIGDGLVVTLTAAGKPVRLRPRGAFGADRHFELGVVGLDGAPIILATGVPDAAAGLTVKAQVALTGKVLQTAAAAVGLTATGGHLVTDFEGAVQWPPAGLQDVEGQGRVRLALTGRLTAARPFDAAIDGDYTIGDSIKVVLDSGAHVVLPSDGFELSSVSPLTLVIQQSTEPKLRVGSVDLKAALPPLTVGKHTIALSNAWVSLEQATLDGDSVSAAAVLRTHAGRDALPARVTLSHDLASATGAFSVTGDWDIRKAVLTTQLPGFDAAYDLDEGTIALTLDGRWDASKTLTYGAKGRLQVVGRKAHYEDYAIRGLRADMPLAIAGGSPTIADTKLSIDAFDVGFPLTDISLGFAVANGYARVRDLSGNVLGGRFSTDSFEYELEAERTSLAVDLSGVSLAALLTLESGHVKGTGLLDGRLPIALDGDAFTVDAGRITARSPGGTLVYKGAAASSMVAQSGVGFAFQALEDFHYDTLDASVALAADGALRLGVRLQGFNPAVEGGRAIQFNLNLNENLPALLQSLHAADSITDSVERRFGP